MSTPLQNSFKTYDSVGNREDLADVIYNIAPSDTPLFSMIGSNMATGTYHEWQTDTLEPAGVNAQVEGSEAEIQASKPTKRVGNYTQIFTKTAAVSNTQEVVNKAGRSRELAYQMVKKTKEIKLDMELALMSNNARKAGGETEARILGGLPSWIMTNGSVGTGGSLSTGDGVKAMVPGTDRPMTEDILVDVLQSAYTNGANITKMMVAPKMKTFISKTFGGSGSKVTTYRQEQSKTAGIVVETYQSDFGLIDVIPNRTMVHTTSALDLSKNIFLLDPKYLAVSWLRKLKQEDLAKTGDNQKVMLNAEMTLEVKNEKACGIIAAVTPTASAPAA